MRFVDAIPVPLSSAPAVKMEDRKRPARDDHLDAAHPLKRQATALNGGGKTSSDADVPWKDDLERYQKEAILRQMQEYKRERNTLEARLVDMSKRATYHDDHLRVIDGWWSQLLDEVKVLAGQFNETTTSQETKVTFPSSLLFSDVDTFEEHLRSRSDQIRSAIVDLFGRLPASSSDVIDLQKQLTRMLATEKGHIVELDRTRVEKEQLEERLENASLRYMVAEKKLERAKSATVAKLERQAIFGGRSESGSGIGGSGDKASSVKQETNEGPNGITTQQDDRKLEEDTATKEVAALSQKRKEQLEKLEAENDKLSQQLTAMTVKLSRLSDDDYSRTDLFKQLKSQHEDVIKRINHLEATNIQLRQEAERLHAERTEYKSRLEAEVEAGLHEVKAQLGRAENDVTRIRNARDELIADLATRKAVQEQDQAAKTQIQELTSAREDRIIALESELERLKLQLGEIDASTRDETNWDALGLEEIKSKCRGLQVENSMLNQELPSMEKAWKKASALASKKVADLSALEERLTKLAAEKSKADQKFFAAMKTKEAREMEVRTLRAQNSKSSEIVSQLKEAESHARQLIINLEKQLAETKEALTSLTSQYRTAQQQLREKGIVVDGLNVQIEELKIGLTNKDAVFLTASKSARHSEQEVEQLRVRLDETKKSLETWKNKGLGNQSDEYEMLRTIAICTVCRKNFKNTALQTCGHVFCKECVQERITSRSRKCPNCGRAFGANDHLHVTL